MPDQPWAPTPTADRATLPARLDATAMTALHGWLVTRDAPVDLDGAGVQQAGTLAIQLLMAAAAGGVLRRITDASAPLRAAMADAGIPPGLCGAGLCGAELCRAEVCGADVCGVDGGRA